MLKYYLLPLSVFAFFFPYCFLFLVSIFFPSLCMNKNILAVTLTVHIHCVCHFFTYYYFINTGSCFYIIFVSSFKWCLKISLDQYATIDININNLLKLSLTFVRLLGCLKIAMYIDPKKTWEHTSLLQLFLRLKYLESDYIFLNFLINI